MNTTNVILLSLIGLLTISTTFFLTHSQNQDNLELSLEKQIFDEYLQWQQIHHQESKLLQQSEYRFEIFKENWKFAAKYNQEHPETRLGMNKFADLSLEEFSDKHLGLMENEEDQINDSEFNTQELSILTSDDFEGNGKLQQADYDYPPLTVDWNKEGKVAPVKNQGECGSCWAFGTIGAIESLRAIETGILEPLSEQKVLDCQLNHGCNGGFIEFAMRFCEQYGMVAEKNYPYVSGQTGRSMSCEYKEADNFFYVKDHYRIEPGNPAAFQKYLIMRPLAINVDGRSQVFQLYEDGIILNGCGDEKTHTVLLTGYSDDVSDGKHRYWEIKNSWGPDWGRNGYVRVYKSQYIGRGTCGVTREGWIPTSV